MYIAALSLEDRLEREEFDEDAAALYCAARNQVYETLEEES